MQTDELEGLHAEPELSGVAPWMSSDSWVVVAPKRTKVKKERRGESVSMELGNIDM